MSHSLSAVKDVLNRLVSFCSKSCHSPCNRSIDHRSNDGTHDFTEHYSLQKEPSELWLIWAWWSGPYFSISNKIFTGFSWTRTFSGSSPAYEAVCLLLSCISMLGIWENIFHCSLFCDRVLHAWYFLKGVQKKSPALHETKSSASIHARFIHSRDTWIIKFSYWVQVIDYWQCRFIVLFPVQNCSYKTAFIMLLAESFLYAFGHGRHDQAWIDNWILSILSPKDFTNILRQLKARYLCESVWSWIVMQRISRIL